MGSSYFSVYEHIVFSTKSRIKRFTPENQSEVFAYLAKAVQNQGCLSLAVGGHENHVHILLRMPKGLLTEDLVREIKKSSSEWFHDKFDNKKISNDRFYWQEGYGAFSVSYWDLAKIKKYIVNQREHHKTMKWEDEFRKLLIKHGEDFNEKYYLD